jgi:hypothetical protein
METSIKEISDDDYRIPRKGVPLHHRNLRWYATADNRVLGVVILDIIDHDYGWVVLSEESQNDEFDGTGYRAINLACSPPSQETAAQQLRKTMLEEHERILRGVPLLRPEL